MPHYFYIGVSFALSFLLALLALLALALLAPALLEVGWFGMMTLTPGTRSLDLQGRTKGPNTRGFAESCTGTPLWPTDHLTSSHTLRLEGYTRHPLAAASIQTGSGIS